jgi:2-oxoglutarate dehydrogenase E2 component (dihydrolipoamide succinyltransferase)
VGDVDRTYDATGMPEVPTAPTGFLSPAVQRLSREWGIDTRGVTGSGNNGRVTVRDLEQVHESRPGDRVVPFSTIRTRTAQNLRHSVDTAVHALVVTEVDYAAVERARDAAVARGVQLTYLPFVARAVIDAIRNHPEVNAVVEDDQLLVRGRINLGIAVDLDHAGLVVPVIKDADQLRLVTIADRVRDVGERGRRRRLTADDFVDGTFTLTNVGRYGTLMSGPIINHPQVAILSTDGVKPRPVALPDGDAGYRIGVHPIGNLSLSFDHRAFDGAYASAFLAEVRDTLETRDWEQEL